VLAAPVLPPDRDRANVAVVGAGAQGTVLAEAATEVKGVDLVGVADRDPGRLATLATRLGLTDDRCFTDAAQLYSAQPIDLAIVATTSPSHAALGQLAVAAGVRRLLVEKPIDVSYLAGAALVEGARRAGTALSVGYIRRWSIDHRAIADAVMSGQIGPPRAITAVVGPGELAMHGSHVVDFCRMVLRSAPVEVTARLRPGRASNRRGREFEDPTGHLAMRFASDAHAFINFEDHQQSRSWITTIYGDDGTIVVEDARGVWTMRGRSGRMWTFPMVQPLSQVVPTASRTVAGVLVEGVPACTGEDGLAALEVVLAALHSSEDGGRPVALPLTADQRSLVGRFP